MSTGDVVVRAATGAVAGGAAVAVLAPRLRRDRRGRTRFAGEPPPQPPHTGRKPDGAARRTAATGEGFARAASSIPERARVNIWHELAAHSDPFRIAYRWARRFGTLFTAAAVLFTASLVALLGDYSRLFLAATLLASAILAGLPALKLHRIAWQALNLSAGAYLVAREGEDHVDE
uniref:hypothetical protein n=1 Tax=Amycolatopsis sp. CA-096443 TaxID=3239919 RepID=UPI003F4907B9